MLRWVRAVAMAWLLALTAAHSAQAEKRLALVIGNSNYTVKRLPNAQGDARAIAQALRPLGFQVELALNQTYGNLRETLQRFSRQAATADLVLLYYAGHGVEISGRNYLVPIDAQLKTDMDVTFEAVSLDLAVQAVEPAKSLRIIILDACRDNPFALVSQSGTRSLGRGLARVDPPSDTLVAFAAKAGSTADDGAGVNSPFTTALLKHLPTPGLDIRLMFGRVRDTVMEITHRRQEPFLYHSTGGREIYLRPVATAAAGPSPAPMASAGPPAPPPPDARVEMSYWESVRGSNSAAVVQSYLDRYPQGSFAPLARARVQELEQSRSAKLQSGPAASVAPLTMFPSLGRDPIRIAVAGPMSGPDAAYGAQLKNGADQAVNDINAAGGVLGRQIHLSVGDDFSNPRTIPAIANRFAADGVKFVIGHVSSGMTLRASEAYREKGILQITPSASSPEVTERGLWNVFRTCGRDDQQGAVAGAYITQHFKGRHVAIVHDRTSYGQSLADEVRKTINAKSMREVMYEGVSVGEKDFSAIVSRIKASGADLVYWGGVSTEGGLLLRQMRDQGVSALVMGSDGITSEEFAWLGGAAVAGTLMTYGSDPQKRPEARSLVQKLRALRLEPDFHTLNSYAAMQIIKQAVEAAKSVEPRRVAEQLKSGRKFKTVIGEIAFDQKGDVTRPNYAMYVWKKDASGKITYGEVE